MIDRGFDPEKLQQFVLDAFIRTEGYLATYHSRWIRYYQMYRAISPERKRIWRANIFVPIPFSEVEHGLADWMEYWFSRRPMAPITPRTSDDTEAAKVMEAYLDWEADDIPLFVPMYEAGKDCLLYGTGWQKVTWDWVRERNNVEALSVWQVYPDCAADNVDDARWIIERRLRPKSWVKRMARIGIYSISEEEIDRLDQGPVYNTPGDQLIGIADLSSDVWRDTVEVMEAWLADPPVVVTLLNRSKLVRAHANPFPHGMKPYVRWVDYHVKGEMLGIGEIEIIEKLVHYINDIRNQRLDAVTLMLNNVLVASRTAGIDPEDLDLKPGAVIWANEVNAIKPLIQSAPIPVGHQEEQIAMFDIQKATANWGYNQGQTPLRRETATTVLALQRAAGKRYGLKLRMAEEVSFKRQVYMRIVNAQNLMPDERMIRVVGEDGRVGLRQIRKDDLRGTLDYIASATPPEPREVKRAQIAQILPILLQHPMVNHRALLSWLLDLYGLARDKHLFLLPDEDALRQAAILQAARGGGGPAQAPGVASPDLGSPTVRNELPGSVEDVLDGQEMSPALEELLAGRLEE